MRVSRGQVYEYDFGPRRDNRIEGPHSVVVVQSDGLNGMRGYSLTIVVPVTSKPRPSPTYVELQPVPESGLRKTSYAKCDQIYTIPIGDLGLLRGMVAKAELYHIGKALSLVLSL